MFVAIISFPRIKEGKDAEFRKWFDSSNQAYAGFQGFISRKLLKPLGSGNYAAIGEFEDQAGFKAMHGSSVRDKEAAQVRPMFAGKTTPKFYEVISG